MESKFKVGDKVFDFVIGKTGIVDSVDKKGNYPVKVFLGDMFCTSYTAEGKLNIHDGTRRLLHLGEEVTIKAPAPKKTWQELKAEIIACEKEWVKEERNYYLFIVYGDTVNFIEHNYENKIRRNTKHYSKEIINIKTEINNLGYFKEFENWFLGKEEIKEDYPTLTGLEPVGTVGYMNGSLVEVIKYVPKHLENSVSCSDCVNFDYCEKIGVPRMYPCNREDGKGVVYKKVVKRA